MKKIQTLNLSGFANVLTFAKETGWHKNLQNALTPVLEKPNGNLMTWSQALEALPNVSVETVNLNQRKVSARSIKPIDSDSKQIIFQALKNLCPWRKGPFDLFGLLIDTEWRSDLKWERIYPHITPLQNRLVLDVGCGSGYHLWRMLGAGAKNVIGIDPSLLFFCQFHAIQKYCGYVNRAYFLPLTMEQFPANLELFDTVFSMGVLYHRKEHLNHLKQLYHSIKKGGELVLETLVIAGDQEDELKPKERYAMMRNVWSLPSVPLLKRWLQDSGFSNLRLVDLNYTTHAEQRSTEWMVFQSLSDFLDPNNPKLTIEGYPAPLRATVVANK